MPETALFALPDETDVPHAQYLRGGDPFVSATAGRQGLPVFLIVDAIAARHDPAQWHCFSTVTISRGETARCGKIEHTEE